MSHTGRMPEVKNRMFTLHPLFTTYHTEIKGENRKVNSVNSSFEKKFFLTFNCVKNKRCAQCV
ncbi:attP region and P4int integrase [Escherichia coli]|nr:attP region and P4int integrase [Escherichia coli]EAA1190837.1 attP region and P4int integrase [Escherichia coli]EEW9237843.1 attP region and P4int integrase [Escherichia coli]EFA6664544.1 attP region and P4int integrase [Escherichia coli]EGE4066098.1 attP region and P4int integrase [Escherichia coli]